MSNEPTRLQVVMFYVAVFVVLPVLFAAWWTGSFETPRERCYRLADRAYPIDHGPASASDDREWNRYFNRCIAKNRAAGINVD